MLKPNNQQPHKESNVVRLSADLSPTTVSDDSRTVEMLFYTGAKIERYDPATGEQYFLRLSIKEGECQIEKLSGAPLLDSHMDHSIRNVLGVISTPRLASEGCKATAHFSDDRDSDIIFRRVKNGTLRQVSVGAVILHLTKESAEGETPSYLADLWYPREVSIVPLAADSGAHFLGERLPIEKLMTAGRPAQFTVNYKPKKKEPIMRTSIAKLEAQAAALAISDRSLSKDQHFALLLRANPQAYNDSVRRQSFQDDPDTVEESEELTAFVGHLEGILGIDLNSQELADEIAASPNAAVIKRIVEQASEYVSAVQGYLTSA